MRMRMVGLLMVLLASGLASAQDEMAPLAGDMTLTAYELTRFLHVVLLVFWLGPEIAIMTAGQFATNTALSPAQRAGAARLMQYYEIMPRVCMSLMLTVGGVLSEQVGLEHPWWQMAGIWLLGPVWLALTLAAYFGAGTGVIAERLENGLRVVLIIAVPVSVTYSLMTGRMAAAPYVGGKLLLFAAILLLGLLARRAFAPFVAGVKQLVASGATPTLDATLAGSFRAGRRYVFGIWAALLIAAFMGIAKFGS